MKNNRYPEDFSFSSDWFSHVIPIWEDLFKGLPNKKINVLEIGCFEGRSSIYIIKNICKHPDSILISVDPHYGGQNKTFLENIKKLDDQDSKKHIFYRSKSEDKVPEFEPNYFDFIYVDGNHDPINIIQDMVNSTRVLKSGGILILDDYKWKNPNPDIENPEKIIDFLVHHFSSVYDVILVGYQYYLRKK